MILTKTKKPQHITFVVIASTNKKLGWEWNNDESFKRCKPNKIYYSKDYRDCYFVLDKGQWNKIDFTMEHRHMITSSGEYVTLLFNAVYLYYKDIDFKIALSNELL